MTHGIRRHPRSMSVEQAKMAIESQISDVASEHDLTYGELFSILSEIMMSRAKYLIREERHGDDSIPGDRA